MKDEKILINVDTEYLQKNKSEILQFLKDTTETSFEEKEVNTKDLQKRFEKLVNYVNSNMGDIISYESNGLMVGYLWYFKNEKSRYHINEIAVNFDFRGKGIGTKLINTVEQLAIEKGIEAIELHVSSRNSNAVRLYEGKGYLPERMLLYKKIK